MVSTPPSLLREQVNAKHTGVMSKQSCPTPRTAGQWICLRGKSICALASFERGLRCAEQSSGSLAEALLSTGGLSSSPWVLIAELFPTLPSLSLC